MADLDPKIVSLLLTAPLPELGLPAPRLGDSMRRRRTGCFCCGEVTLGGPDDHLCWGCQRANCTELVPGSKCPMQMQQTQRAIWTDCRAAVDMAIAVGQGRNTERDDDRMSEDRVLLEHLAWRSLHPSVMEKVYGGREILPPYPTVEPIPMKPFAQRTRDTTFPARMQPIGMALQHQILTRQGWYYEHLEGYPPLLVCLKREEGLRVYYQASSNMHVVSSTSYFGPYGEDRHAIPAGMKEGLDEMEEQIGLECLAEYDIARVFLTPPDDSGLVLLHRVMALNQQIVDNHVYTNDAGNVPNHELKTLINLWARVREESTTFENVIAARPRITKRQATAGLLIREGLEASSQLIKQLLISSC